MKSLRLVKTTLRRQITPCNEFTINLLDMGDSYVNTVRVTRTTFVTSRVYPVLFSKQFRTFRGGNGWKKNHEIVTKFLVISLLSCPFGERARAQVGTWCYKARRFKSFWNVRERGEREIQFLLLDRQREAIVNSKMSIKACQR